MPHKAFVRGSFALALGLLLLNTIASCSCLITDDVKPKATRRQTRPYIYGTGMFKRSHPVKMIRRKPRYSPLKASPEHRANLHQLYIITQQCRIRCGMFMMLTFDLHLWLWVWWACICWTDLQHVQVMLSTAAYIKLGFHLSSLTTAVYVIKVPEDTWLMIGRTCAVTFGSSDVISFIKWTSLVMETRLDSHCFTYCFWSNYIDVHITP